MAGLTRAQIQQIAKELILLHNSEYEFDYVYEHDDADQWTEDEQSAILDAMYRATITVTFDEEIA